MPDFTTSTQQISTADSMNAAQPAPQQPQAKPRKTVDDWVRDMRMSADVNQTNLGVPTDRVTPELLLATSSKLLKINRREVEDDKKDSLQFQRVYGPADFIAEHVLRDGGKLGRNLLWKATNRGNLDFMQTNALDQHVSDVFNGSKLANMIDGSSPLETVEASYKVSRIGEGGIASQDTAPVEMRLVQPSFLGYIDPVRSVDSLKVGLDTYMTKNVRKGSDGKLYQTFINAHTGKPELVDSVTAAKSVVTTPDMMKAKTNHVFALGGDTGVRIVKKSDIDYYLPYMDDAFSKASNMIPGLSGVKELRLNMGCLHPLTSLVTVSARNEVSIVPAKDVNSASGILPGMGKDGAAALYHIVSTYAKFPRNRAWFRKIVLYSGRAMVTSRDHRWPVLRDGELTLVEAAKLRNGDKVLRSVFKGLPARRTFLNKVLVNKDTAILLGYAVRSLRNPDKDKLTITYNPRHKADLERALKRHGIECRWYVTNAHHTVAFDGGWFHRWLQDEIGVEEETRRMPSCVLSANLDVTTRFLDAFTADENRVAMDAREFVWVLDIRSTVVRDGVALLLARTGTDTLYRDAYVGDGRRELALKLVGMPEKLFGDCVVDEVKSNLPTSNAAIMIDIDIDDNMYAAANGIVTHNSKYPQQAISIEGREAPLVRSLDEGSGKDMQTAVGKFLGARFAKKPGTVAAVRHDRIDMLYDDGTKGSVPLYVDFPMNAKGYINNAPQVKAGQHVGKGDLLASSNYTDKKGVSALGTNLRTGWISWHGGTYEDAIVISESAAKKLTSTTMYSSDLDLDKTIALGKKNYLSWKPGEYSKEQLSVLDDEGIVKPGTVLAKGDPMVLAVRTSEPSPGTMGKRLLTDLTETWDHEYPGVVTDVLRTRKGVKVLAKVTEPAHVGDKLSNGFGGKGVIGKIEPDDSMPRDKDGKPLELLFSPLGLISRCYDDQTEFLTRRGWLLGKDVQDDDLLYCFDRNTWTWHWGKQRAPFWRRWYDGQMYTYHNDVADFSVTEGHRVWAKSEFPNAVYVEKHIEDIFGRRYYLPCVGRRREQPEATPFVLPPIYGMNRYGTGKDDEEIKFEPHDWATFLGWYMAEGSTEYQTDAPVRYCVSIAQFDTGHPDNVSEIGNLLDRLGLRYYYRKDNKQFHISWKRLAAYTRQFGHAWEKFIPDWLFEQPDDVIHCFLDALWAGDGSITPNGKRTKSGRLVVSRRLVLTSERLIDQVQALYAMLGIPSTKHAMPLDTRYKNPHRMWFLGVSTVPKTERLLRHGWAKREYHGMTYCPTVDTGYIMTRRNGRIICMGNTNSSMLHEALLGKVAHASGKPERLDAFTDGNIMDQVIAKLKQHHLKADDDFFDPETGRKIPSVVNGYSYIYKLKHLADSKLDERGTDDYAADETPGSSSKRLGMLEVSAMTGHGAFDNLIDGKLIRGQSNSDFWRSLRTGGIPTMPGEPLVQKKFFAHLQGSGINVRKTQKGISVFALAQQDVDELAGKRELKSRDTYTAKTFRPIDGGLFGQDVFGINGDKWGYIQLDEPVPNPVMAQPLAKLLRMSDKDFEAVASGSATVNGMSSSADLKERLSHVNLDAEAIQAKREFKEATPSKKDAALKRYVAIENMRRLGASPDGYMLDRIPVLPPVFRPVTSHNGLTMVADANYLYAQLLDARDDMREAKDLPEEYQVKARQNLYRTWNELTGLYAPEDPKLKNKNVGGLLAWALGKGSPKFSALQRKVVGMSLDTVGRGAVVPNAKITIDQVGLPEDLAFGVMAPFVERSLVKRGYTPMDAMKMVKKRAPQAVDMLREVMKTHPVLMNRAPTLHKFNILAFEPVLVKGDAIQVNPSICPGMAMDFDGDTVNIHVPVSDSARREAWDRMRPSRNLISPANRATMNKPEKEYIQGLYIATRMGKAVDGRARFFKSLQEAKEAYRQGIIDIDTPIQLPDNAGK